LLFQIGHPFLDQDPVPFPFGKGLSQKLNQPLGLLRIMSAGLQIRQ
jgi:hypothetical protein